MNSAFVPSWTGVALSVVLVAIALGIVLRERVGLAREMLVAALRAAVQLIAVGALLRLLFEHAGLPGSLAWVSAMVLVAGRVAGGRGRPVPRATLLATVSVAVGVAATLGLLILAGVIETTPRVVVPIGGMIVSGAMQSTSLVLQRVAEEVASSRHLVEARLALGLSAIEAFRPHQRLALRTALTPPVLNTKVVGLISLPGAMTGLILAGLSPLTAIRYQIVVMYMLLGASALAGVLVSRLSGRVLFDDAHRMRDIAVPGPRRLRAAGWLRAAR